MPSENFQTLFFENLIFQEMEYDIFFFLFEGHFKENEDFQKK